jgi:ABC-type lipoprotein export system ATPase subunit
MTSEGVSQADRRLYGARDLRFIYTLGNQRIEAIRGVSLEIAGPCFLCVRGPSGSGKTTLLNLLGLIEPVQEGSLSFEGIDVKGIGAKEANTLRRGRIGFIFQNCRLMNVLRADENVEYFLSRLRLRRKERKDRVREALEQVGLWEHRFKKPLELSGGQRQSLAIARALAKLPSVILADEPTANLDQASGRRIMELLESLHAGNRVSVIVTSHDPMVQARVPARIDLTDGVVSKEGIWSS